LMNLKNTTYLRHLPNILINTESLVSHNANI
jgi:hypothetical protein